MAWLQTSLDKFIRPELTLGGKSYPAYQVCGFWGIFAGFAWMLVLASQRGLELPITAGLVLLAYLVFLGISWLNQVLFGYERLAMLEQVWIILLVGAGCLALAGRPVFAYLDILGVSLSLAISFGRVGCLLAGCCHGKPAKFGVCYGPAYEEHGMPGYLAQARLFPLQLLEAGILAILALGGSWLALRPGWLAGETLAGVWIGYCLVRFITEFARGDAHRPYLGSLSLNQWLCLGTVSSGAVLLQALSSPLFGPAWLAVGLLVGLASMKMIADWRSGLPDLDSPRFLVLLQRARWRMQDKQVQDAQTVVLEELPGGLRIGLSRSDAGWHYSFSRTGRALQRVQAHALAQDLALLHGAELTPALQESQPGVFHCFLPKIILPRRAQTNPLSHPRTG